MQPLSWIGKGTESPEQDEDYMGVLMQAREDRDKGEVQQWLRGGSVEQRELLHLLVGTGLSGRVGREGSYHVLPAQTANGSSHGSDWEGFLV